MIRNAPSYVQTVNTINLHGVCYRKWRIFLFRSNAYFTRGGENYIMRSLMVCIYHQIFFGYKSRRMRWAGHVDRKGEGEAYTWFWWGDRSERDQLDDISANGINYLLALWSRFLHVWLNFSQLVKKFYEIYVNRKFISAFKRARHVLLSWASSIQSLPRHHSTSWKSTLIISSQPCHGLHFTYPRPSAL